MSEKRYEIIKLLGKGRTGGVYEAIDTVLGRKVAMRRFFGHGSDMDIDKYKKDFEEVAHELSVLQHPNLLSAYDAGVDDEGAYIITQLLKGEDLDDHIAQSGPMPYWEVSNLAQQMLDALSTAHIEGYVHGALTPGSILMTTRARGGFLYVILDLGLSRLAPLIQGKDSVFAVMADPAILAPELFDGGIATVRGDLYMLGQILYMSLAGGHPFGGLSANTAQRRHQEGLPPIQHYVQDLPEDFCLWLDKLVQFSPDQRPVSAMEALSTLPQVIRPASNPNVVAQTTAPQLVTTEPPQKQTAGVIQAAPTTLTAGVGVLRLPPAKTDPKKLLLIGLAVLFLVVAITITVIFYKKNSAKLESRSNASGNSSNEETVRPIPKQPIKSNQTKNSDEEKKSEPELRTFKPARKVITHFDASKTSPDNSTGWQYVIENQQATTKTNDGWVIDNDSPNGDIGIKFPLKSYERDMFESGWRITYVVRPVEGRHRFGFSLDKQHNPGWKGDGVGFNIELMLDSNMGLKVFAWNSQNVSKYGKSIIVPYNGPNGWYTIVVEQSSRNESGTYSVYVDGKFAFEDLITEESNFVLWGNHLFSASVSPKIGVNWVNKEMKLETF